MIKSLALAVVLSVVTVEAMACGPAPSCWMEESKEYLRTICRQHAREGATASQISKDVDEPHKVPAYIRACKSLGVTIKQ